MYCNMNFAGIFGLPVWGRWIVAYLLMSTHGLWMDLYRDVYVLPEHDTPWSLKWKVICSHLPNMLAWLAYLALYNNQAIFIMLQALALTGAAVSMRVPPFWVKGYIHPPRAAPVFSAFPMRLDMSPRKNKTTAGQSTITRHYILDALNLRHLIIH